MSAPPRPGYDLKSLDFNDSNIENIRSWNLVSALNEQIKYRVIPTEALNYFDCKQRFVFKQGQKTFLGYCCIFTCQSGSLQEDLLADFLYLRSLQKRYPQRVQVFDDIILDQTEQELRVICLHQQQESIEIDKCIRSQIESLIKDNSLINMIIKIVEMMQKFKDSYYYEYELNNHNILIQRTGSGSYELVFINQLLPLLYRNEYVNYEISELYEEDEYELNETLLFKKLSFLIFEIALGEEMEKYADAKGLLKLWREKKLKLPREPIKYQLIKVALNIVASIENKQIISLQQITDRLIDIDRELKQKQQPNQPITMVQKQQTNIQDTKSSKKKPSQGTQKSKNQQSDIDSSQYEEEIGDSSNEEGNDDYGCVPVNNIDNETVHIKVQNADDIRQQISSHFMIETDPNVNGYQSDAMRSLHMLGDGASITIKKKTIVDDPNNVEASSTIINVNQIRLNMPSSRGGKDDMRPSESDKENNPSVMSEDEENDEEPPKLLKGDVLKNQLLKSNSGSAIGEESKERPGITSSSFGQKRELAKYKNYALTFTIMESHKLKINCLCYLFNEYFASGSSDKTIKVWSPFTQKPVATLEDDEEITLMLRLGRTAQGDVTMLYVACNYLRLLSIKQQKAVQLLKNDKEITALCKVNQSNSVITLGTANGMIKDFDLKNKCVIRRAKLHSGSKVTSIVSQGKYLISASENGSVIVYDYMNQELFRELKTSEVGLQSPNALCLLKGDRYLVVSDDNKMIVIDVERAVLAIPSIVFKDIKKLTKLSVLNEDKKSIMAACSSKGDLKFFAEDGESTEAKWIDLIKNIKAHQGDVTDVIALPNGALVSCGNDRRICLWEEKRGNASCGSCCNIV